MKRTKSIEKQDFDITQKERETKLEITKDDDVATFSNRKKIQPAFIII